MNAIHRILAATDFSDDARAAAARAAQLAAVFGARLELMHVLNSPWLATLKDIFQRDDDDEARLQAQAVQELGELATALSREQDVRIESAVRVGVVRDVIREAASRADLLVLGPRGLNPIRDLIVGSTAERLLNAVPCPILVVKRPPLTPYRRVLVAVDFSSYSAPALVAARQIAPDADLHVCHAFNVPYEGKLWIAGVEDGEIKRYRNLARQRAVADMDALVLASGVDPQRILRHVEHGDPGPVLLGQEIAHAADLIVIGKQGHGLVEESLLGSVTRHLLSDARCDILVVHTP